MKPDWIEVCWGDGNTSTTRVFKLSDKQAAIKLYNEQLDCPYIAFRYVKTVKPHKPRK